MPGSHKRTPKWKKGHPARAGQEKEEHSLKINTLILNHFMLFENAEFNWSKNINIICGENSTGKTTLLKVMYSILKPLGKGHKEAVTKEIEEKMFVDKLQGVFRPDGMKIGRMVTRKQGSNRTDFSVLLEKNQRISRVQVADGLELANPHRFRVRSLPAAGALLRDEDRGEEQLTLL